MNGKAGRRVAKGRDKERMFGVDRMILQDATILDHLHFSTEVVA
jgi:hypothetical protein